MFVISDQVKGKSEPGLSWAEWLVRFDMAQSRSTNGERQGEGGKAGSHHRQESYDPPDGRVAGPGRRGRQPGDHLDAAGHDAVWVTMTGVGRSHVAIRVVMNNERLTMPEAAAVAETWMSEHGPAAGGQERGQEWSDIEH